MKKFKIGGVPEHFNYPWRVAIEEKAFDSLNVSLHWSDMTGGTGQMIKGLETGSLDIEDRGPLCKITVTMGYSCAHATKGTSRFKGTPRCNFTLRVGFTPDVVCTCPKGTMGKRKPSI